MHRPSRHKQCKMFVKVVFLLFSSSSGVKTLLAAETPSFSLSKLPRCTGVSGTVCDGYYAQYLLDLQQPRALNRPCPGSPTQQAPCGLGVCHGDTGLCDCPAGAFCGVLWYQTAASTTHPTCGGLTGWSARLLLLSGVGGPDCSSKDSRPCTNRYREDRNSSTPASHIGSNSRDLDWREAGWTPSR